LNIVDAYLVYLLHWMYVIGALSLSWRRSGHYLHPHFLMTGMFVFYLSDFLVRGNDDNNLRFIREEDYLTYQLICLTILTIITISTLFVRSPRLEANVAQATGSSLMEAAPNIRTAIFTLAVVVISAILYQRLSVVGWSIDEVMRQSLNPRGEKAWDIESMSGNFIFAIASILTPFAAIAGAYLFGTGKGAWRMVSLALFAIVILILVTDGSRTPVAIAFATLGLFWSLRYKNLAARAMIFGFVLSIMVGLFSLMYLFRSTGYNDARYEVSQGYAVTYHQDDNYHRALFAYAHSEQTGKQWSAWFFFTTIAVNPIPRAFWPEKPLIDATFYDGFKLDYVTNSFLGETVALTGIGYSVVFAPLFGFCFYLILFNGMRLLPMPMGIATYLMVTLYVYQCIRSMQNLTLFLYLPAFAVVATIVLDKMQQRSRRAQGRGAGAQGAAAELVRSLNNR
jgi:oligosaccharide repeat unit polymerase